MTKYSSYLQLEQTANPKDSKTCQCEAECGARKLSSESCKPVSVEWFRRWLIQWSVLNHNI